MTSVKTRSSALCRTRSSVAQVQQRTRETPVARPAAGWEAPRHLEQGRNMIAALAFTFFLTDFLLQVKQNSGIYFHID